MAKKLVAVFCVLAYAQLIGKVTAEKSVDQVFRENEIIPDVLSEAPKEILKVRIAKELKKYML